MSMSKQEIQAAYQRQAKHYDFAVKLYRLIGLRIEMYRSRAIRLLSLKPGDFVVDLGCGTGLNFPLLIQQIGPEGRLIGVDFSSEMLSCARERITRAGWENVELVQSDITDYDFPDNINGVLSTGVFGYIEAYDSVIESAANALASGGRLVTVDGKRPEHWPLWLFKTFVRLSQPFGLTLDYFDHQTWKSVERLLQEAAMEERYGGLLYISSGTALRSTG